MRRLCVAVFVFLLSVGSAWAVPISDGSIYFENFAGNIKNDPDSYSSGNATISSNAGHVVTTTAQQGVFRAGHSVVGPPSPLNVAAGTEYVLEFDFSVNAATSNMELLRPLRVTPSSAEIDIFMRASWNGITSGWSFTVQDFVTTTPSIGSLAPNQFHHFVIHHKANVAGDIDLWVNGSLIGTYKDRSISSSLGFIQWGDSSGSIISGNISIDNISLGSPVAVPEPWSLTLIIMALPLLRWCRQENASHSG
jgi:hypothetical protein